MIDYAALKAGPCRVTFIKKDGTQRTMLCTQAQDDIERVGTRGTGNGSSPNVVTVIDLDKDEWRCFKPSSVIAFEVLQPS